MAAFMRIYRLGVKELWSLWRDPAMLLLILYAFSANIYIAGTALPQSLHKAPIAIVDEDQSPLSMRLRDAFYPPDFLAPALVPMREAEQGLERGQYTFVLTIPPNYQADLLAGRAPALQLLVDATRMGQAFTGNVQIQQLLSSEVQRFVARPASVNSALMTTMAQLNVGLELRALYNPTLTGSWFGSVVELINSITLISIVLTGAALIREREHGTIEHLLVMPVAPYELMVAKIWSMGLVVLVCSAASLLLMVKGVLQIGVAGSLAVFLLCTVLHLLSTCAMGICMATFARSMPQFGLLLMMTLIPLQMLSGGITPRESMPTVVQDIMLLAPTTHFVAALQAVLFRDAGIRIVWPQLAALLAIAVVLFSVALRRFRQRLGSNG